MTDIVVPTLGESVSEATVAKWKLTGTVLDILTAEAAEDLADRGRGLAGHVLEEDVSCSQYAAAVYPLARQAATCFFHVAASAIPSPCTAAGRDGAALSQRARR